ncbi:helix-turn-helix domain-containing protein [Burkholderia sp. Ac-20345]|uniref:helix-turn-helix domain-containing protein n=1 Tax=Burkholderia sp. Ac-20345 TaxID=2703891 RepID=UPI00197C8F03|nr:helix-turn-helix transcriptional regulator [Burkholderia sp. Ac-20345]MBN3780507.1 helix-turn-helix domain-containing protein [Burkholderia sp. Ac-20345]
MDWQAIIKDLTDRARGGMTQRALAKRADCGVSTISDLATGVTKRPNGDLALTLTDLHKKWTALQAAHKGFQAAHDAVHRANTNDIKT